MALSLPTFAALKEFTATQLQLLSDGLSGFNDPPRAMVYQSSTTTTLTTATPATLAFDAENIDVGGFHASTSSKLIVPSGAGGAYAIAGSVGFASNSTGYRNAVLLLNTNTALGRSHSAPSPTTNTTVVQVVSWPSGVPLNDGDEIELQATQASGGNLATIAGISYTWLSLVRLHD